MKKTILTAATCFCFIALKFWYASASTGDLQFVLSPTKLLVEIVTGNPSTYLHNEGHYYPGLDIIISKSCSGFNFFMTCLLMLMILLFQKESRLGQLAMRLPMVFLIAYGVTLLANCSRISTAVFLKPLVPPGLIDPATLHESIGIVIYLSFLVTTYLLTEKQFLRNLYV